jgi:hypothetical protein
LHAGSHLSLRLIKVNDLYGLKSISIGHSTTGKIYYGWMNLGSLEGSILVRGLHGEKMRYMRIRALLNAGLEVKDGWFGELSLGI